MTVEVLKLNKLYTEFESNTKNNVNVILFVISYRCFSADIEYESVMNMYEFGGDFMFELSVCEDNIYCKNSCYFDMI